MKWSYQTDAVNIQPAYAQTGELSPLYDILARDSICAKARYNAIACPSVCLPVCPSVTRVDQSKKVEVRIMQLSPQSSPMTLVSSWLTSPRNSEGNIGSMSAK